MIVISQQQVDGMTMGKSSKWRAEMTLTFERLTGKVEAMAQRANMAMDDPLCGQFSSTTHADDGNQPPGISKACTGSSEQCNWLLNLGTTARFFRFS